MLGMGVEEIRRLSQEEGFRDAEIALLLGVCRATVNRIRIKNNIPSANLKNRKDKMTYCNRCRKTFIIRRGEKSRLCSECTAELYQN